MIWFEELTVFKEQSPEHVRSNMVLDGKRLTSKINGKKRVCGRLEMPSLAELRAQVSALGEGEGKLKFSEAVGDVRNLHFDAANANSLFQVAPQFNRFLKGLIPSSFATEFRFDKIRGCAALSANFSGEYRVSTALAVVRK